MAKSQKRTSREAKKPKADTKSKSKTASYQSESSLKDGKLQAPLSGKKG